VSSSAWGNAWWRAWGNAWGAITPPPVDPATPADRFDYLATLRVPGAFHAQQLRPSAERLARLRSARRRR
jgi:hypothetical protein